MIQFSFVMLDILCIELIKTAKGKPRQKWYIILLGIIIGVHFIYSIILIYMTLQDHYIEIYGIYVLFFYFIILSSIYMSILVGYAIFIKRNYLLETFYEDRFFKQ